MAYDFKNLNGIPTQDKPTENTTVMAFESGTPKQIPAGKFGGNGLVVDLRSYDMSETPITISDISYDPIYEAIKAGKNVVLQLKAEGMDIFALPMISGVAPGIGFSVSLGGADLVFTNGSYHTTV